MSHIKLRPKPRRPKPPEILTTTTQENINLTMCSKTECPNEDPSYCWCDRPVPTTTTNASGATMPQTEIMVNVLVSTLELQLTSAKGQTNHILRSSPFSERSCRFINISKLVQKLTKSYLGKKCTNMIKEL